MRLDVASQAQPFTNCRVYLNNDIFEVAQLLCDCAPGHRCKGGVLVDRHCLIDIIRCHCQSVKLNTYGQSVSCSDRGRGRGGAGDGCVHWWLLDNACRLYEYMREREGRGREGRKGEGRGVNARREGEWRGMEWRDGRE